MPTPPQPEAAPPPHDDRRRSVRVYVKLPVTVVWTNRAGMRVREPAETQAISRHGALLRVLLSLRTGIPVGTDVELHRPGTADKAAARVVWASEPRPDGAVLVGVELAQPSDTFWGVPLPDE
jgi:hypothetical protein